jgi:protein-disulfide isomerase
MKRGPSTDESVPPPHAARWPYVVALLLGLTGLILSALLEQIHFKVHTDPGFHSFCSIDRTVNCDLVARSPYAVAFGVSVATWGMFGYALALAVALWGVVRKASPLAAGCGLYLAIAFTATSAALGAISALVITAVCILCLGTYAVNLLLLVAMLFAARGVGAKAAFAAPVRALGQRPARTLGTLALVGAAAVVLVVAHPSYWKAQPGKVRAQPTAPKLPTGIEPGGGHYIGAEHPAVTLTEFSDYECPFCRQAHTQLRALLERYPNTFRLVHRHYPLDMSCNSSLKAPMHENACFAAMIAECAGHQNKFWQANDYLFAEARMLHSRPTGEIAHDIGLDPVALEHCLKEEGPREVAIDVDEGNRLNIQGTPTFLIDGKTFTGAWPPWLLARIQAAAAGVDAGAPGQP